MYVMKLLKEYLKYQPLKFTQLLVTCFRSSTNSPRQIKKNLTRLSMEELFQGMMANNSQEEQQKQSLGTSKSQDFRLPSLQWSRTAAQRCRNVLLLALTQQKNPKLA